MKRYNLILNLFLIGDVDSGDDNESDDRQPPNNPSPASRIPPTNQSQRRLRPPTSAVRNNFHNHSSGRQQSPSQPPSQPMSVNPSPLSHQSGAPYGGNVRLVPVSPQTTHAATAAVNHLDLLSGLSETGMQQHQMAGGPISGPSGVAAGGPANVLNRQMRMRVYGNGKGGAGGGMPRHETKL